MDKPEGRRGSDVLDAILDKVAEGEQSEAPANVLFRAKALEQLDIPSEVDTRLPLVSRRSWLALVGVALLVAAFALWASLTPSVTSVNVTGRVIAAPGAIPVSARSDAVVTSVADPGKEVSRGSVVATLSDGDLVSTAEGSVWQQLVVPGGSVRAGQAVVTLLPPGSADQVLLAVPEAQASAMTIGMKVQLIAGRPATGAIESVSGPMSAQQAGDRTGLALTDNSTYVLVGVRMNSPLTPGVAASGTVVLSEGTVLTRLLGRT